MSSHIVLIWCNVVILLARTTVLIRVYALGVVSLNIHPLLARTNAVMPPSKVYFKYITNVITYLYIYIISCVCVCVFCKQRVCDKSINNFIRIKEICRREISATFFFFFHRHYY